MQGAKERPHVGAGDASGGPQVGDPRYIRVGWGGAPTARQRKDGNWKEANML